VIKDFAPYYTEPGSEAALDPDVVADVTWALRQSQVEQPLDGPESAGISGTKLIADSALEASHAWHVGYTTRLAMAVWVGNQEMEFPLRDTVGDRITGETLPADVFRIVIGEASRLLDLPEEEFGEPANIGDSAAGDAS
jgi:membrane peptidoglycan carboxypeptidase